MSTEDKYINLPFENKMEILIDTVHSEYNSIYNALYENGKIEDLLDNNGLSDVLIEKTEKYFKTRDGKNFIKYWNKYRHDLITSDREYIALALALDL